jgi:hypothetical protein
MEQMEIDFLLKYNLFHFHVYLGIIDNQELNIFKVLTLMM